MAKDPVLNSDGSMDEMLEEMEFLINSLREDATKFDNDDNYAASTRVRVGMQDIKRAAQEVRVAINERRK